MADKTDQFNPYLDGGNAPDFTSASRGADPQRFLATRKSKGLFDHLDDIGRLVTATTNFADAEIKDNIQEQASQAVDFVRDESIGALNDALDVTTSPNDLVLPPGLKTDLQEMRKLTTASLTHRLKDSYYWSQMDFITRRLKQRYPGHKDFVDSYIGSLVGRTPANALRAAQQDELKASLEDSPESAIQDRVGEAQKGNIRIPSDYKEYAKTHTPQETLAYIDDFALKWGAQEADLKRSQAIYAEEAAAGEATERSAERMARKHGFMVLNNRLVETNDGLGKTWKEFKTLWPKMIKERTGLAGEDTWTPEEQAQLTGIAANLRAQAATEMNAALREYAEVLPAEKLQNVIDGNMKMFDSYIDALTNKDIGTIALWKTHLEALQTGAIAEVLSQKSGSAIYGARETLGGEAFSLMMLNDPEILAPVSQFFKDYVKLGAYQEEPTTLNQTTSEAAEGGASPKALGQAVENVSQQLANLDKAPPEASVKLVKYVFGPGNENILKNMDPASQREMYMKLANDTNAKAIFKLAETDPTTWQNYRDWVAGNFTTIFKRALDTAKEINVNRRFQTVTFDFARGEFKVNTRSIEPFTLDPARGNMPAETVVSRLWEKAPDFSPELKSQEVIKDLNVALKGLTSVLKQEGTDVGSALTDIFTIAGLTPEGQPGVEKQGPAIDNFLQTIRNAIGLTPERQLGEKIGGLEAPGGYSQAFADTPTGFDKPVEQLTIGQIRVAQNNMVKANKTSSAIGRYQITRATFDRLVKKMGIAEDVPFDKNLQDKMFYNLLKERGMDDFLAGKISKEKFAQNLSKEWASLPNPTTGKSYYDRIAGNKSLVGVKYWLDYLEDVKNAQEYAPKSASSKPRSDPNEKL